MEMKINEETIKLNFKKWKILLIKIFEKEIKEKQYQLQKMTKDSKKKNFTYDYNGKILFGSKSKF